MSIYVLDHIFGITPYLGEQAGANGVHPVKTDEIKSRYFGYTALVTRISSVVKNWQIDPTEVISKSGSVDNAADACLLQL